jgi:mRNA interferase RelE/StbE
MAEARQPVREPFKTKLAERLAHPKVPSARLHGAKERYKIKLRNAGYRLVYEVRDREWSSWLLLLVIGSATRSTSGRSGGKRRLRQFRAYEAARAGNAVSTMSPTR